jgi:hypothetical protein
MKRKLERLDGQKLYDADFEIAKAYFKIFLKNRSKYC